MGRLRQFGPELLDQPRLAEAGFPDDLHELAFALNSARPAAHKERELVLAADERRQCSRPAAPAAAAGAHDAVERDRLRDPLELLRALVFNNEQPRRLPQDARSDEHRPQFGRGLHSRRNVRRVAEHFAGGVDHDGAALDADAGGKLRRARSGVPGVEAGERALDGERRAHRALGVVLLRLRIAEQGHQSVAEFLQHVAANSRHRVRGLAEIGADQVAPVLGAEPRRQTRRADEIAEHHRDRTPLRRSLETLGRGGIGR